jgi:histidinol-phosphate phosphatase family protein
MTLNDLKIDKTWSLFLDRDGVINERIPGDYVKKWNEFIFLPGVREALAIFTDIFGYIFVVTNQQGIGKGMMTETELEVIHDKMIEEIRYEGGHIHKVYHSPFREEERSVFRKPNTGMARKAKIDFPAIDFNKSMMIGDSMSDMEFGRNAGMITCYISPDEEIVPEGQDDLVDFLFHDLFSVAHTLTKI